jgi:hypothetical protein
MVKRYRLRIVDCGLRIDGLVTADCGLAGRVQRPATQSAIRQSAIRNRQSVNRQSAIDDPQWT